MALAFDAPSQDKSILEEGTAFTPKFDAHGLITAVVTDARDNALLMVAHYFSRSRGKIWKKGETSGNLQTVVEMMTDCDQDALLLKVTVAGHDATCHTGRRSCFYRRVEDADGRVRLAIADDFRHFVPKETYKL